LNSAALILVTNALLLLQPTHTPEQKRLGAISHGILNSVALAAFTTAVIIILYNKAAHGADHFTTAHGRIGLVTYIFLIIQVLSSTYFVSHIDLRWCPYVLLSSSVWVSSEGKVHMEISSSKWVSCLDFGSCKLRSRNTKYLVHWSLEQYMGMGFTCDNCSFGVI